MVIEPGQMLLHYRLIEKIGAGGMGEVWRALDTTLDREAAIKILPEALAVDAERMARFEREAKLLGSLNHSNIATIYGLHEAGTIRFIAMEYVPGEDLMGRLARGAMPLDVALVVANDLADALEAAHERGVIHRDLKPANVRLTPDGTVKVLDFGLAKTLGGEPGEGRDPSLSPTMTSGGTSDGIILGTAAYMSPEQARGRPVDRRADIWAFGCLVFECLTGRKAFPGETISDTLAAVLKSDPDWSSLPASTPEPLQRLLRRCLAKDPKRRLSSLGDARLEIEDAATAPEVSLAPSRPRARSLAWLVIPVAVALVAAALAIVFGVPTGTSNEDFVAYRPLTHQRGWIRQARIAPDGQTVIYSAAWEGRPLQLFLRRLDSTDALPVALEPHHARMLSVSSRGEIAVLLPPEPDSVLLPTFNFGTLARVPLTGGTPRAVAEGVLDADWDPSGEQLALIRGVEGGAQVEYPVGDVLYRNTGTVSRLRVSPTGDLVAFFDHPFANNNRGTVSVVDGDGEMRSLSPELENLTGLAWSPDGSEIWFSGADEAGRALFAISLSGRLRVLRRSFTDLELHDITADGRLLVAFRLFHLGIVARAPEETSERDLSWIGMSFVTDVSPDGERILFLEQTEMEYSVWLRRMDGSAPTRLGAGMSMSLSPDGKWALASLPSLTAPLTLLPTGPGTPRELEGNEGALWATWMPDGEAVVFAAAGPEGEVQLFAQDVDGGEPREISSGGIQTGVDRPFRTSPNGRWVAAIGPGSVIRLYPVEGGDPREVRGSLPGDEPLTWTEDSGAIFVGRFDRLPGQVFRLDLESGERRLWNEVMPRDPAGIGGVYAMVLTPDGQGYAYTYSRRLDSLHVMTGLR